VDAVDDGDFGEALHVVAVVEFACLNGSQIRPHAHLTFIPGKVAPAPQAGAIMTYWRKQLEGELPESKAVRFHGTISSALRYLAKGPRSKGTTDKNWDLAARHLLDPFEDDVGQRAALYLRTVRVTPWELQCIRARAREASVGRGQAGKRWRRRSADRNAAKQVPNRLRLSTRHAPRCPNCKSTHIKKDGRTNAGTQRFKCRTCSRKFSDRAIMARREKAAKERRLASDIYHLREGRKWTWRKICEMRLVGHYTAQRLYEQHRARHHKD
jgi:transposase-like protein